MVYIFIYAVSMEHKRERANVSPPASVRACAWIERVTCFLAILSSIGAFRARFQSLVRPFRIGDGPSPSAIIRFIGFSLWSIVVTRKPQTVPRPSSSVSIHRSIHCQQVRLIGFNRHGKFVNEPCPTESRKMEEFRGLLGWFRRSIAW